jgi:subtilisin family serine protease
VEELLLFHFFMFRYFRIIIAEIALTVFLWNMFIPSLVWADEITDSGSSSIVQENLPGEIVPTDTGTLMPDVSDSTGEILETNTGFTETGSSFPETTSSGVSTVSSPIDEIVSQTGSEILIDQNIVKKSETAPEDEILVQFKTDIDTMVGQYQVDTFTSNHDIKITETISENNIVVVTPEISPIETVNSSFQLADSFTIDTGSGNIETMIEQIKQDPRVEHVQKNFIYTVQSVNDSDFWKLWWLHNEGQSVEWVVGTPDADIDYPEAMNYASGKLWTGVIVAVLDTGIAYNHPDLAGHMWNGQNCLSDTGAYIGGCMHGYDFANQDIDPQEWKYISHGTHVAGTIWAITNNGTGIVWIAPNVTLMAVKVCNNWCSTSDIIRGINFARYNGAKVINASFGAWWYTPKTIGEFDYLTYQTIQNFPGLFIAAAGNDGFNSDTGRFYPAWFWSSLTVSGEWINASGEAILSGEVTYPWLQNTISVAASDENDNLASFSNYGTGTVHIAAPWTSIYSTYRTVSSETDYMTDGWVKTNASHSWILFMNSGYLWNGWYLFMDDLSTTLSWEPLYTSGSNAYIEKIFTSNGMKSAYVASIPIWCDTPNTWTWKDYISIWHDSGNGYIEDKKIDEDSLWSESWATGAILDGREGVRAYVSINLFDTLNSTFKVRLWWHTDNIDDIDPATGRYYGGCRITSWFFVERTDNGESGWYNFLQWTSMAAPHVAGAAALAMSYAPNASISDIRNAILWSSDYKSQLLSKIMYGRLNVANMLKAIETPVIQSTKVTLSGESGARIQLRSSVDNDRIWKRVTVSKNPNFYGESGILPEIETLFANGIISSNSEARVDSTMTRAEFAKIISNLWWYTPTQCLWTVYVDVNSSLWDLCWYIEALWQAWGYFTGASFFPTMNITNGEFYKMLISGIGEQPSQVALSLPSQIGTWSSEFDGYAQRVMELWCGINPNFSANISRSSVYSTSVCATKMPDITDTRSILLEYGQDTAHILGLSPDTTYYYYTIIASTTYSENSQNRYQSFRTPKIIPQTTTGWVVSGTWTYYLSGSSASGVTYGAGGNQKLILSDSGNTAILDLSLTGVTITASGTWDGIFVAPTVVATSTSIALIGGTTISSEIVYEVGSPTNSLTLSGKVASITIKTANTDGTVYKVYRSDDKGVSFTEVTNCIVNTWNCTFTTNHFSQFALGNPTSPVNPIVSIGWGGGWGGPGWPTSTVVNYSAQFSLQNILNKSLSPALSTSNNILSSVDGVIVSLQKHAILSYLQSVKYDSQKKPSENAQKYLVDPIIVKVSHGMTRGQKLLGYDFALHALDTKRRNLQISTLESTTLNIAFQKISDARLKYIRQAFSD